MAIYLNLRKKFSSFLQSDTCAQPPKNSIDQLLEEICLWKIELEIQALHLQDAQSELEAVRKNYLDLYHSTPAAYFTINQKGAIIDLNTEGEKLLACPKTKLLDSFFNQYIAPESQYMFSQFKNNAFTESDSNSHGCKIKLLKLDGTHLPVYIEGKLIESNGSKTKKLLMVTSDVIPPQSAKRLSREIAFSTQDTTATDFSEQLAGIFAREFSHSLGTIGNYVQRLTRYLHSNTCHSDQLVQSFRYVSKQLTHASDIIVRMKNTPPMRTVDYQPLSVNDCIQEVISLINHELYDFTVSIDYQPDPALSDIWMDKLHLQTILLNLARHVLESLKEAKVDDPQLTIQAKQVDEERIEICLLDNGSGEPIDEKDASLIPHFLQPPQGTISHLVVTRSIIAFHGGELLTGKRYPCGAYAKFTLPLKDH